MPQVANACGYAKALRVTTKKDLQNAIAVSRANDGVTFIEVQVRPGNRADIGRPTSTPAENKVAMMQFLGMEQNT
jgi:phosphonopyruvate decarboxylase